MAEVVIEQELWFAVGITGRHRQLIRRPGKQQ
jgi:hypothetical protein